MKKILPNTVINQALQDYNENIVCINEDKINSLIVTPDNVLAENEISALKNKTIRQSIRFLIALNSINYQFWEIKQNHFHRYQHNGQIGAIAMFYSFEKLFAHLENHNFDTNLINENLIIEFFGDIPEKIERISILKESFDNAKYELVYQIIVQCACNHELNVEVAAKISEILPLSYKDPYLKKIQLALYEISEMLNRRAFKNSSNLTVAADYQIPKVLEALGIISYCEELRDKINNHTLIDCNSIEERAIRAATILASDKISRAHNISIPQLDRILWLARNKFKEKKFHLTRTSYY